MGDRGRRDFDVRWRGRRGPAWMLLVVLASWLAAGSDIRAETPAAEPGLDDLLRLPSDFETKEAARPVAGVSEDEWKKRFSLAEKAIGDARDALAETRRELDGMAETGGASQWSVAPPGASGQQATSPLSFKLRQELQRNREALDAAEKALRDLRIEADLAGVPAAWRVVASSPPPSQASEN